MKTESIFNQATFHVAACAIALCCFLTPAFAQVSEDDTSRRFWPPNFRPAAAQPGAAAKTATTGRYKRTTPALLPVLPNDAIASAVTNDAVVGITLWRLRPSKETDEARILVKKSGRNANLTPERVEAGTKFSEGQMLRLSIEIPRTGYLYVIDREQYADGTMSEPYLIFPTDLASNENRVTAGRVVEIPNQSDDQAYFEVHSLREAGQSPQIAEALTVLVTPTPLRDLPKRAAGDDAPLQLTKAQVETWEREWGARAEQLELENGAGAAYTKAEQAAGRNPSKRLTRADPLPQTIFRVAVKAGRPLLVKLPLSIGK